MSARNCFLRDNFHVGLSGALDLRLRPASIRVERRLPLVLCFASHDFFMGHRKDMAHQRIEPHRSFRPFDHFRVGLHRFYHATGGGTARNCSSISGDRILKCQG